MVGINVRNHAYHHIPSHNWGISATYSWIRGHVVVYPQQLGLLLNLFPSSNIQLHDRVQVVWLGKRQYTKDNIRYFCQVRKAKVVKVLMWLKDNNSLYKNIVINFDFTNTWEKAFVSAGILNGVLQYDEDIQERKGCATDMEVDDF